MRGTSPSQIVDGSVEASAAAPASSPSSSAADASSSISASTAAATAAAPARPARKEGRPDLAPVVGKGRVRASRSCLSCRGKRSRCNGAGPPCGPCEENGIECIFESTGLKRGPPKGYVPQYKRARQSAAAADAPESSAQGSVRSGAPETSPLGTLLPTDGRFVSRLPSDVLSNAYIEHLLALYFAHTHVVWPIIDKPMFHHARALPALLWAMLALAACISPSATSPPAPPSSSSSAAPPAGELSADGLFAQALSEIQRFAGESRIELVQALVLLSLRQTGNGMKSSAWNLCGQACTMAIDLGLHNAGRVGQGGLRARSSEEARRVWWNAYILDKTLAEETGRPYILRSRRCTTPLPSVLEPDEFEPWPPVLSAHALPALSRIAPSRAHALTTFNSTCRLGLIVERIMDLDEEAPTLEISAGGVNGAASDVVGRPNGMRQVEDIETLRLRDVLNAQLDDWWTALPDAIRVHASDVSVCPLPHCVVNIAWFHSARILLHSRFINNASREYDRHSSSAAHHFEGALTLGGSSSSGGHRRPSSSPDPALVRSHGLSHAICTEAADEIVKLVSLLDRWKLLSSSSSDVIHLVSHATLFQVYNSSLSDLPLANRAKLLFVQCCQWLKTFSSSWPAASHHKTFFEGLISGGLDMSPDNNIPPPAVAALYPDLPQQQHDASSGGASTSPHTGGPIPSPLPFADDRPSLAASAPQQPPTLSPTSFFKTPSFFWNEAVPQGMLASGGGGSSGVDVGINPAALQQRPGQPSSAPGAGAGAFALDNPGPWESPADFLDGVDGLGGVAAGGLGSGVTSAGGAGQDGPVNNSVYDALMAYMHDSGRG